jgi:hemerythrin superfamily protein
MTKKSATKSAKRSATEQAATQKTETDIIQLILEDHKALKELIEVMKDSEKNFLERSAAFEEFAPLLVTHAKPEEESLYVFMKDDEDLRENGFEGDVEHALADQMIEEIKRTEDDEDLWSARVKVLAEMVEHHIEEEEDEMLPDVKKHSKAEDRARLGEQYLKLRAKYEAMGGSDAPHEKEIAENRATH